MKITRVETLRCDAGWRMFSFCKITTDSGPTGWSEFNESFGSAGLAGVIEALAPIVVGEDPRRWEFVVAKLQVHTRQSRGGLNQQAIAAFENALLDIAAKDRGLPVYRLLGGPIRDRIPVYWSHMGTYRVRNAPLMSVPAITTRDELTRHAAEIREAGFRAMKTNIFPMADGKLGQHAPGFGRTPGWPALNWDKASVDAVTGTLAALREGAGPEVGILLDLNFNFRTEGFRRVAAAVAPYNLTWLEIDTFDPAALALIRGEAPCPIASCETLCHRRDFRPFFEHYAMDVAIVDVVWNGLGESLKIAAVAETYEVNCAPHNFYGHLCTMHSATFSAMIPNFRIMELDLDSVAWRDEFYTGTPVIENGELILPDAPGWGIEVNEAAVRARPPKT